MPLETIAPATHARTTASMSLNHDTPTATQAAMVVATSIVPHPIPHGCHCNDATTSSVVGRALTSRGSFMVAFMPQR